MKQLVFSVTAKDCEWKYTRGTGNGGQKKNKTNSAVHCVHKPSRAHGYAEDSRSQIKNRQLAFKRMAESKPFKEWLNLEFQRRTGQLAAIEDEVNRQLSKIKIEIKDENGLWMEVPKESNLDLNV